ncbi:MAG: LuxR C-terminal-related transcriptional regulator [Actinomycetota bacterium]|nr:LuxR C-terminal-related transcriptional regulator [Actinomycetota bacterium]
MADNGAARPTAGETDGRDHESAAPFPMAREPERPPHNLPLELTSFVGREREVAEVKRSLGDGRLLTLTGPGGCGKSRLAMVVAFEVVEGFADGVWWVGLAPLSDPALIPQVVAQVLGLREAPGRPLSEALVEHLHNKRMLLVLDNCEHLIDACAELVGILLRSCPELKILATSREALGIAGERAWVVPSLSVPGLDHPPSSEGLMRYEAVRLFVERARAVASTFELTDQNASSINRVCHQLEGMPLAIELAAASTRVLSAEQIASRLDDSFQLLRTRSRTADPRQQTLRAAIDWSHRLLSEEERTLFRRLSVFAGSFGLRAAESACAGESIAEDKVLDLLANLVDKSLVLLAEERGIEARYRLLETIRQYGAEKLEESGEEAGVRWRHADFFLRLAEEAEPELKGSQQVQWVHRLSKEHDNLRAAMRWFLQEGESERIARLGWALWLFWWIGGHFTEGRRWTKEALEDDALPASSRAKALFVVGTMANGQGDSLAATALLEESLGLFRELGDERGVGYALCSAGLAAVTSQELSGRGTTLLAEATELFLEVGDKWGAASSLGFSATGWFNQGDYGRAKQLAEQGLALFRETGDRQGTSVSLCTLVGVALAERDQARTRTLSEEGLKLSFEVGDRTNVAYCLGALGSVAASEGRVTRAARLWGAAETLVERIEATVYAYTADRSLYRSQVTAARTQVDEAEWEAAWSEGRAMTPEEATEYALSEEAEDESVPSSKKDTAGLSERELEILRLVAGGRTDSQVAERLFISPRTVGQHLRSIYRKLGVPSRAAAAREAVERGLI